MFSFKTMDSLLSEKHSGHSRVLHYFQDTKHMSTQWRRWIRRIGRWSRRSRKRLPDKWSGTGLHRLGVVHICWGNYHDRNWYRQFYTYASFWTYDMSTWCSHHSHCHRSCLPQQKQCVQGKYYATKYYSNVKEADKLKVICTNFCLVTESLEDFRIGIFKVDSA